MAIFKGPDAWPKVYTGAVTKTFKVQGTKRDPASTDPDSRIAVDFTGWTLVATVKRERDDAAAIITKSSGVLAASTWSLIFDAGDFTGETPGLLYLWIVGTPSGGDPVVLHDGRLQLKAGP